ncbi:unnamed protein product [Closterium sp. NIES-54]
MEVVALRAVVSVTKSTPDRLHARLAHVGMNTIRSLAKHEVATGLDLKSASGADFLCVSCVGGKLVQHKFPDQGSDADDVLAFVHIDLCGPFRVGRQEVGCAAGVRVVAGAERHGGARDEDGGGIGVNDVAAHGRAAPLVASRSTAGHLGPQLPGAVDTAAGDDAIPAADREEARLVAGTGLLLGVSVESKGWELLDLADNRVVTTSDVVFYENVSLEVWKSEHGPGSGRTPTTPPTDTSTATLALLAEVGEPAAEDVEDLSSPSPSPAPPVPPLVADLLRLTPASTSGDEGSSGASPKVPTKSIAGGRRDDAEGSDDSDNGEEAEESTDSDVVEVQGGPRRTGRLRRPPDFFVPAAFTTVYDVDADDLEYDDVEDDEELPELDPDMYADPEHRWDISTMTVKEALASWKGNAVKAAMEEEICSVVGMGTWELVERPPGVNIMKNRWVLTMKYHIDDTVECEKARLVVKGFMQVYGTDYDETYAPVSSYVMLRIFLSIFAVLDLNLMQLDMKNAFLQSKLVRVLYMHQPDYFNDGTGRVCKLLKSLYGLKQSPLLWYRPLDGMLLGAG